MTRYLVTGCAGFIGSHVARELLNSGADVIGVDGLRGELNGNHAKLDRLAELRQFDGFTFAQVDLRYDSIAPLVGDVDVVLHFAALAGLPGAGRTEGAYHQHNELATQRIVEALDGRGIHLVHASTSSVYGEVAIGDESLPLNPVSPYGRSKVAAENQIQEGVLRGRLSATVLRLFSVYGPGQRPDMAYAKACRSLLDGQVMHITGDGSQSRSNTYIDDVVSAAVRAAELQPTAILNVSGVERTTLLSAIDMLATALGVKPRLEFVPARAGDQISTAGDISLARSVLGWAPKVPLSVGLVSQAHWFAARAKMQSV